MPVTTIAEEAITFIIDQEDGDERYYDRTENHWDWPEGESGPTAGVGYDCGYVTHQECTGDWSGIVDDQTLTLLTLGVGYRGEAAHSYVRLHRDDITITWEQAVREFRERELPKWEKRMAFALPNWDHLSPLCAGALLSLGYNRGTGGFASELPRFREMRNIKRFMLAGNWGVIGNEIEKMRRLWPRGGDLYNRRRAEANLFRKGVAACRPLIITT